ncbi:expansin EXLX1 family cellulose-binding protein [Sphaerisporangium sp. NPDC049003]|uniref:expansin EXLX1 family cellulose-binding protein n=1 Tax=Sphaerisporangium sp. NPDC049003 TaxID=3364517 RepID=UPI003722D116
MWQRLAWALSMAAALTLVALGAQAGRNGACAEGMTGRGDSPGRSGLVNDRSGLVTGRSGFVTGRSGFVTGRSWVVTGRGGVAAENARWLGGDCSLGGALLGDLVAAVSAEQYAGSAACGAYLDVTGPGGTVRVQVVDECVSCAPGELDLSRPAFARVAGTELGVTRVSYHTVHNPEVPRPVAFRLKQGSSSRWLAIQAIDHGNPLQRLEVLRDGRWQALTRDFDNYWVADHGIGTGPYTVRITDVYGQRVTATGIRLVPRGVQRTTRRLYGPAKSSPVPRDRPAHGTTGGVGPRAGAGDRDGGPGGTLPSGGDSGRTSPGGTAPGAPGHGPAAPGSQGDKATGAGRPAQGTGAPSDGVPGTQGDPGTRGDGVRGSDGLGSDGVAGAGGFGSGGVPGTGGLGSGGLPGTGGLGSGGGPGAGGLGSGGGPGAGGLGSVGVPGAGGFGGGSGGGSMGAGAGAGVSGSEEHTATGTLDTPSDGTLPPDPDRAPLTALPSSRPFFC